MSPKLFYISRQLTTLMYNAAEEEHPDLDDDGNDVEGTSSKVRRVEQLKANPTFMAGVSGATVVADQPRLSQIQHKVQDMCGWTRCVTSYITITG